MATWGGWVGQLLTALGAPSSAGNQALLEAWSRAEGGTAAYNPMNTTQDAPGATAYNSVGVRNYPSAAVGIQATVATLTNGYYDGIVKDMRAGTLAAADIVNRNASEFDTWGTGASHVLGALGSSSSSSGGGITRPSDAAPTGPTKDGGGGFLGILGDVAGLANPFELGWETLLGGGLGAPLDFLKAALWLVQPKSWLRMVEFATGMLLMLLGLVGLAVMFLQRNETVGKAAGVASALPGPLGAVGKALTVVRRPEQAAKRSIRQKASQERSQRRWEERQAATKKQRERAEQARLERVTDLQEERRRRRGEDFAREHADELEEVPF